MITAREKRPALLGYAVVFLFALAGTALFARLAPYSERAVRHLLTDVEAYPAGYRLFLNLQDDLWILPALVLFLGLVSWKSAFLRHHVNLALISSLVGGVFAACGALMATPYFMFAGLPALPLETVGQLQTAHEITLYSLEPMPDKDATPQNEKFHGINVLGKTTITNAVLRQTVINALLEATTQVQRSESLCFNPRHGLKIVSQGRTTEISLCFECAKLRLNADAGYYSLTSTPQPLLDKILSDAGVPLSKSLSNNKPVQLESNHAAVNITREKTD